MNIKFFAINLEENNIRRQHILQQAKSAGIELQIFKAITHEQINDFPHTYTIKRARCFIGRPLMNTEIACGLSHITLWRKLLNDDEANYYLILEDDAYLDKNIKQVLGALDLASNHIDFLRLNTCKKRFMKTIKKISNEHTLCRYAHGPLLAVGYLISKKAAPPLIKYCENLHAPIDILMDRSYDHGVPNYGIFPYLVKPAEGLGTDIGLRNHKYTDDIRFLEKLSVRYWRFRGSLKKISSVLKLYLSQV